VAYVAMRRRIGVAANVAPKLRQRGRIALVGGALFGKLRAMLREEITDEGERRCSVGRSAAACAQPRKDPYSPLYELGRGKAWQMHA